MSRLGLRILVAGSLACCAHVAAPGPRTLAGGAGPGAPCARASPDRLDGDVVYGVVPPLFGSPPLDAVTSSLADLQNLGVDILWLAPLFDAPAGDYGYAVTDYLHVRRSYGTEDDLRRLVDEAHRRRMRVLLDFVPNHTSTAHPFFLDALARGASSPYFGFYARDGADHPTHYFDWAGLPNLNYESPELRSVMFGVTQRWVRDFRVDGFRMDAAWGVRRRSPGVWAQWIADIRRDEPEAILVAEATARDGSYFEDGFDVAYDWTDRPGAWAWEDMFEHPETIAARVWDDIRSGSAGRTLRFLDNNDTGPRFVTRHGPAMTRVAAAMMLTLPGLPCLFTGDERGAEFEPYVSGGVPPGRHAELRAWYQWLIGRRHALPSLRHGAMFPVGVEGAKDVFAFARMDRVSREGVVVVLNYDGRDHHVALSLPPELGDATRLEDEIGKTRASVHERRATVDLAGWGVVLARVVLG